jgi:CheY-like chemotaxis protein
MQVMIVDDSEDAHEIYRDCLGKQGYQVLSALSGRSALSLLASGAFPHVILVDILMPHMDGMEFIVELHREPRFWTIPIVIASAVDVPTAVRMPNIRYLTKPFRSYELLVALRESARTSC